MLFGTSDTFIMEKGGSEDAESLLGARVVGHIPTVDEQNLRVSGTASPLIEGYRGLRANLRFVVDEPLRSILVTSSVPREGKSTTVANLAVAMAMVLAVDGKRLIVVDADLRRPTLHRLFNIDSPVGLVDVLLGTKTIEDVLRPTEIPNLWIIPAGTPSTSAAELLESESMGRFLNNLDAICDMVLIDSPSVLGASDATVIAARMSAVLVVVAHGDTKRISVQKTVEVLRRARSKVVAVMFNRVGKMGDGYYYSRSSSTFETAPKNGALAASAD